MNREGRRGNWERGWAGPKRAQLARLALLSLPEKLAWLEQAHRLVRHLRGPRLP